MIQKIHGYFHLTCDVCGEEMSSEDCGARFLDFVDTLAYAKSKDWTFQRSQDGWEHICPVCSSIEIDATTLDTTNDAVKHYFYERCKQADFRMSWMFESGKINFKTKEEVDNWFDLMEKVIKSVFPDWEGWEDGRS